MLGAAGAVLRWLLGETLPVQTGFPWTTFLINVTGSGLLALLPGIAAVRRRPTLAVGLGTGLCGGYTTLSTYSLETRGLLAQGDVVTAGLYAAGTLLACLAAVALASRVGDRA